MWTIPRFIHPKQIDLRFTRLDRNSCVAWIMCIVRLFVCGVFCIYVILCLRISISWAQSNCSFYTLRCLPQHFFGMVLRRWGVERSVNKAAYNWHFAWFWFHFASLGDSSTSCHTTPGRRKAEPPAAGSRGSRRRSRRDGCTWVVGESPGATGEKKSILPSQALWIYLQPSMAQWWSKLG